MDEEDGLFDLLESQPDDRNNGRESSVIVFHCCAYNDVFNGFSRKEWADILRRVRKTPPSAENEQYKGAE